jgi:hypothetical protein
VDKVATQAALKALLVANCKQASGRPHYSETPARYSLPEAAHEKQKTPVNFLVNGMYNP